MTQLQSLIIDRPDAVTVKFYDAGGYADCVKPGESEDGLDIVFQLDLRYVDNRKRRKIQTSKLGRKPITKTGIKALLSDEEEIKNALCMESLAGWNMTFAALPVLRTEKIDYSRVRMDEPVEFNDGNIKTLLEHSDLSTCIINALGEKGLWFGSMEDAEGNSKPGQSGSTDRSPAGTASTDT
jgi:hypothetical protein